MKESLSVRVEEFMVDALEKLNKAKHIWLSSSGKDLFFGDGRNLVKDNIRTLIFYSKKDAQRYIKYLNLKLDDVNEFSKA